MGGSSTLEPTLLKYFEDKSFYLVSTEKFLINNHISFSWLKLRQLRGNKGGSKVQDFRDVLHPDSGGCSHLGPRTRWASFTCALRQTRLDRSQVPCARRSLTYRFKKSYSSRNLHAVRSLEESVSVRHLPWDGSGPCWLTHCKEAPCRAQASPLSDSPRSPAEFWPWEWRESNSLWSWMKCRPLAKNMTPNLYLTSCVLWFYYLCYMCWTFDFSKLRTAELSDVAR